MRARLVERRLDAGGETYLFGGAREARKMTERGSSAIRAAGFGALSIHDARPHLRQPDDRRWREREGAERLHGARTVAITFDLYGHMLPGAHDEAAGLLDTFLARHAGAAEDVESTGTGSGLESRLA